MQVSFSAAMELASISCKSSPDYLKNCLNHNYKVEPDFSTTSKTPIIKGHKCWKVRQVSFFLAKPENRIFLMNRDMTLHSDSLTSWPLQYCNMKNPFTVSSVQTIVSSIMSRVLLLVTPSACICIGKHYFGYKGFFFCSNIFSDVRFRSKIKIDWSYREMRRFKRNQSDSVRGMGLPRNLNLHYVYLICWRRWKGRMANPARRYLSVASKGWACSKFCIDLPFRANHFSLFQIAFRFRCTI